MEPRHETPESAATRLLLVEDDPLDAHVIQRMLSEAEMGGFAVRHFSTLNQAANSLDSASQTDIILLDLSLIDATVGQAIDFIGAVGVHTPVVVLTGNDNHSIAMQAVRNGAQDYLVKWEFNPTLLRRSLRYAMERQHSERRLREALQLAETANNAKTNFLAMMTHEIRTPLSAVLGMAELMAGGNLEPDQRQYLNTLNRAGQHLLHVVDDVLDLSRIESGRMMLERQRFALRTLVAEPMDFLQYYRDTQAINMSWEVDPDVPVDVIGDPRRLKQILVNILGNAIKFTQRGFIKLGVSVVGLRDGSCDLQFAVTDSGIGIAPERLSRIFDSFEQADVAITRRFGGSGLGLTIVKSLVELMGGRVWVESTVGEGTKVTFTVNVEIAEKSKGEAAPASARGAQASESNAPAQSWRVLVVDDSEDGGILVQGLLTRLGHEVEVLRDGSAATAAMDRGAFDIVLMDVHMPGKDGFSVTREIRGREALKGAARVPILFVTANTLNETRIQAAAAGGNGLITKPITAAQLVAGIDAAIERVSSPGPEATSWESVSEEEHSQVLPTPSEVDNVIEPLLPRYLAARRSDVSVIKEASNRRDAEVIKTLGHNMKGSGTSYGLPQVSAIGDTLEKAAGEAAWERVARAITDLERALDRLEYTLEERVTPMSLM